MKKLLLFFILFVSLAASSFAHKPELVSEYNVSEVEVLQPEISKAYYGIFDSKIREQEFVINSDEDFNLYANFLLPVNGNSLMDKRLTMQVYESENLLVELSGVKHEWTEFFEPFGYDKYLMGPEFEKQVGPGLYRIVLSLDEDVEIKNADKVSYSVAIGKIEDFGWQETLDTYRLIPQIKTQIFDKSGVDFVLSPLGGFLVVIMLLAGFVFGYLLKFIYGLCGVAAACGIQKNGRVWRGLAAVILLILSLFFGFSKIGFFLSGLVFFESIKGFCFVRFLKKNP